MSNATLRRPQSEELPRPHGLAEIIGSSAGNLPSDQGRPPAGVVRSDCAVRPFRFRLTLPRAARAPPRRISSAFLPSRRARSARSRPTRSCACGLAMRNAKISRLSWDSCRRSGLCWHAWPIIWPTSPLIHYSTTPLLHELLCDGAGGPAHHDERNRQSQSLHCSLLSGLADNLVISPPSCFTNDPSGRGLEGPAISRKGAVILPDRRRNRAGAAVARDQHTFFGFQCAPGA